LDLTPGLDLGLIPILGVTLEVLTRQLASMDKVAGEFFSDVRVAHGRSADRGASKHGLADGGMQNSNLGMDQR